MIFYNACNDYENKIIYDIGGEDACKKCEYLPETVKNKYINKMYFVGDTLTVEV